MTRAFFSDSHDGPGYHVTVTQDGTTTSGPVHNMTRTEAGLVVTYTDTRTDTERTITYPLTPLTPTTPEERGNPVMHTATTLIGVTVWAAALAATIALAAPPAVALAVAGALFVVISVNVVAEALTGGTE